MPRRGRAWRRHGRTSLVRARIMDKSSRMGSASPLTLLRDARRAIRGVTTGPARCPTRSLRLSCDRGHLDAQSVPPPKGRGARAGALDQRDDGKRSRPARVRRPREGGGLPRCDAHLARSCAPRRHGEGVREHPGGNRGRAADLRPRRLRRGRHLRDGARAPRAARARCRCRLAPTESLRRGLRRRRGHARATRRGGLRPRPDGRLRHHSRRRGRAGEVARPRRGRDRPPSTRRPATRLSSRGAAAVRLPVQGAVRHRGGIQALPGAARIRRELWSHISISSRSRPSPMSCRSSTRTEGLPRQGCVAWHARASPGWLR